MTPQQMRDALERATELAPPSEVDPDAIWLDAHRANRNSRLLLVVASLVIGVMAGGLVWRGADFTQSLQPARPVAPPPSYEESVLGFPDDLWSIPAGMPTTAEEGPIGPLALVSMAEHKGPWPWSDEKLMVYGVSAVTGEYRFLSLPGWTPLSLRGWTSNELNPEELVALSPDGSTVAYPHENPELGNWPDPHYDGVTLYNAVTGETQVHTIESPQGIDFSWMEWSPDSSQLAMGLLARDDPESPGVSIREFTDAARYDVATNTVEVIPDSHELSDASQVSWKPEGLEAEGAGFSSGGLVLTTPRVLRVLDPVDGSLVESYRLNRRVELGHLIWKEDGRRFVASAGPGCAPECPAQQLLVMGTLRPGRDEAEIDVIARASGKLMRWQPLGWNGNDRIVGRNGINYESWFELGESSSHRQLLSVDKRNPEDLQLFKVAADALRGDSIKAVEPVAPWGLLWFAIGGGLLVAPLAGVWGLRRRMRRLATPSHGARAMADFVWRRDAASALTCVTGILVSVEIVWLMLGWRVRQDWSSLIWFALMLFLLWRVWRRGLIARFPLFLWIGFLTALATMHVVFADVDAVDTVSVFVALGALGGWISSALLLSPAVVAHVAGTDAIPEQPEPSNASLPA